MVHRQVTALDFASSWGGSNERVEGGCGQHFRGRVGEVERHQGRAVGLVEIETLNLVVSVDGDLILLQREGVSIR